MAQEEVAITLAGVNDRRRVTLTASAIFSRRNIGCHGRLLKKRRQFQERVPDSPCQRNADDEPVNEKLAPVSSGLDLVSHNILLRFSILSVEIITLVHRAHGKIAD